MPDEDVGELAELRRRAYGPAADIDGDPVAQARLAQLEAAHSSSRAETSVVTLARDAESGDEPPAPEASLPPDGAPVPEPAVAAAPDRSRLRRRLPWIAAAAGAVVAAMGLFVAVSDTASGARPAASLAVVARPDAVLEPRLDSGMLYFVGAERATLRYHGMVGTVDVWTVTGLRGSACIVLSLRGGLWDQNCAPSPLPALLDVRADNGALHSRVPGIDMPPGSYVRFAWSGQNVDVYVVRNGQTISN
ncbi:hypothetical protein AAIB33_07135 [Microbacterium sp. AZCO]|uniref:hypothetical protein n=1 Tax=Microbacterium sp. AZCO TaxID=3142976 RepID=UPI0031F3F18D